MTRSKRLTVFSFITEILCVISICTLIYALSGYKSLIEVRVSDLTGECIEIVDENGKAPCPEVLPERYIRVIVYGGEK